MTRSLLAPPVGMIIGDDARCRLRDELVSGIGRWVEPLPPGDRLEVTLPVLRNALDRPWSLAAPDEPFSWRPRFVRRSLGLAVVEACAAGRFRTPAEAVEPVSDEAVGRWERTGWRTYHWEPWLAGLTDGARATVLAEAVTWATSLWTCLRWADLPPSLRVGGVDDRWSPPTRRRMCLRGRAELRVPLPPNPGPPGSPVHQDRAVALVSVAGGRPGVSCADELAFLALVAGLGSPEVPVPVRVVGLWPDAGRSTVVEVDERVLGAAAERVITTVGALVDARRASAA